VVQTPEPIFVEGSGAWLTVREAAIYLKVSRQTIYDLIGRGELAHIRVGNMIRIPQNVLR
jgi:excisionase family DNA binding protein